MILNGSTACWVEASPVSVSVRVTEPFLAVIVVFGSKPKNEY